MRFFLWRSEPAIESVLDRPSGRRQCTSRSHVGYERNLRAKGVGSAGGVMNHLAAGRGAFAASFGAGGHMLVVGEGAAGGRAVIAGLRARFANDAGKRAVPGREFGGRRADFRAIVAEG